MHMKHHPLIRTSQDIRRSITRLRSFISSPLPIPPGELKTAKELVNNLEQAQTIIPEEYRDADLKTAGE